MRLTQKQETFCLKYFELGNASKAALIAGYSPKTVRSMAAQNLLKLNIQDRLQELQQKAEDASVATVLERKQRLTEIVRANIPDYVENGGIRVEKQSPNVGAVSEITTRTKLFRKSSEPVVITNLKLHSPIHAISELNKMEHIYSEGTQVNIDNRKVEIIVTSDTAKKLTKAILNGEGT